MLVNACLVALGPNDRLRHVRVLACSDHATHATVASCELYWRRHMLQAAPTGESAPGDRIAERKGVVR